MTFVLDLGSYSAKVTKPESQPQDVPLMFSSPSLNLQTLFKGVKQNPSSIFIAHSLSSLELQLLVKSAFEDCALNSLFAMPQPLCCVFAVGVQSATVIDIGFNQSRISLVLDNCIIGSRSIPIGGHDITIHLERLLANSTNINLSRSEVREIKEELAQCAATLKQASQYAPGNSSNAPSSPPSLTSKTDFTLESGKVVSISNPSALALCVEVLFDPSLVGKPECQSLPDAIYSTISSISPIENRILFWESLLLTGGSSKIPGIKQRLEREIMRQYFPVSELCAESQAKECKFLRTPEYCYRYTEFPNFCAFLGAQICAKIIFSSGQAGYGFITRQDYEQYGPSIITRKF